MKKTQQDQTFESDLGQKAIVEHVTLEQDNYTTELAQVLEDMALDMQKVGKAPKEYEYLGSFAVHIYASSMQGNFAFSGNLNPKPGCHRMLADAALKKLRQDVEEYFTGRRQKLRSGF